MTDSRLVSGILQNDERVWRYIVQNMKGGFISTLRKIFNEESFSSEELDDLFADSCAVMMGSVKGGRFEHREGATLFSFLVGIGKNNVNVLLRKRIRNIQFSDEIEVNDYNGSTVSIESEADKQAEQDEFLDRVFDSIPSDCKTILKRFYWDHKPMDEIASSMGLKNADTAITKKSRCMNKFRDIAKMLVENDEYAEEAIRNAVERAALRDVIKEAAENADSHITIAALETDE